MTLEHSYDAIVVGSGPNGLSGAIALGKAGLSVAILEAKDTIGGGMRTAELTLPGFLHDICSAIQPLGIASPFFKSLQLEKFGVEWIQPSLPLAHPLDNSAAVILDRSTSVTADKLGADGPAYLKLMEPFVRNWNYLAEDILAPFHFPQHPLLMAQFGMQGIRSANGLAASFFRSQEAKAIFAGLAAHSTMPLNWNLTAAIGIILGTLGHVAGWPLSRGGSQKIADALSQIFLSLGGKIETNQRVDDISQLSNAKIILLDISPKELIRIGKKQLPSSFINKLEKFQYGPGVFKMDWALSQPIPWKAKECTLAGTVHVGGSMDEISLSEGNVWKGIHPEKPFVLVAQQSLFDPTRAPEGKQTAWAYCHVPNGSDVDMSGKIEAQIERFAPGFSDCILARSTRTAVQMEQYNSNLVGGDITGGVQDFSQLFKRPVSWLHPYTTPLKGVYLCSSSTPPGGGVHGMCGYHAAQTALKDCL